MRRRRHRAGPSAVAVGLVVVIAATGCGRNDPDEPRDGLGPDTARFSYGDRSVVVSLTACGRDGDVVVLAAGKGRPCCRPRPTWATAVPTARA
jgi:predicted small lipoprotein YifL